MIYGVRVKIQSRWQVVLSYYQQIQDFRTPINSSVRGDLDTHKFICERKGTDFESVPGGV